jgi:hypothetical protein
VRNRHYPGETRRIGEGVTARQPFSGEQSCGGAAVGEAKTFKIYADKAAGDSAAD